MLAVYQVGTSAVGGEGVIGGARVCDGMDEKGGIGWVRKGGIGWVIRWVMGRYQCRWRRGCDVWW